MTTIVELAQFYETLFKNNRTTGALLSADVFYGDQTKLNGPLTLCVEPGQKDNERTRAASGRAVKRTFTIYVYAYANYTSSESDNRLKADQLAEKVEDLIHQYPTCSGRGVSVLVTNVEPGYVTKQSNTTYTATRLTISITKEEFLPQSAE